MSWDFLPFKKLFERQILQIFFSVWLGNPRIDHLYLLHLPLGEGGGGEQGWREGRKNFVRLSSTHGGKGKKEKPWSGGGKLRRERGGIRNSPPENEFQKQNYGKAKNIRFLLHCLCTFSISRGGESCHPISSCRGLKGKGKRRRKETSKLFFCFSSSSSFLSHGSGGRETASRGRIPPPPPLSPGERERERGKKSFSCSSSVCCRLQFSCLSAAFASLLGSWSWIPLFPPSPREKVVCVGPLQGMYKTFSPHGKEKVRPMASSDESFSLFLTL